MNVDVGRVNVDVGDVNGHRDQVNVDASHENVDTAGAYGDMREVDVHVADANVDAAGVCACAVHVVVDPGRENVGFVRVNADLPAHTPTCAARTSPSAAGTATCVATPSICGA